MDIEPKEYNLDQLNTHPNPILNKCTERYTCPQCKKTAKYFCYRCCRSIGIDPQEIPRITLPFHLYILKHKQELDSKSTAIHAKMVAPDSVTICQHPSDVISSLDPARTILLYPAPDAMCIDQIDPASFDQAIVVDGTWSQARSIMFHDQTVREFRTVTIHPRITRFWRFQNTDRSHMATIEAIYFLYRDFITNRLQLEERNGEKMLDQVSDSSSAATATTTIAAGSDGYDGRYDDLMFYYKYFYHLIQQHYREDPNRHYNTRHISGYIKYDDDHQNGGSKS